MGGGSQETVHFVGGEAVTRPTALSCTAEKVGGWHLMALVFRVQCTCQTVDSEQAIMALADRGGSCCPLQDRFCLDKLLGPPSGKIREAVEHVCLDLVLKSHTPVQLDVTIDGFAQHDLSSLGQDCAISWRVATSTFA